MVIVISTKPNLWKTDISAASWMKRHLAEFWLNKQQAFLLYQSSMIVCIAGNTIPFKRSFPDGVVGLDRGQKTRERREVYGFLSPVLQMSEVDLVGC